MTLEEILEHLYDLDRTDLRRLTYEALLMSDGPDHIDGEVDGRSVLVIHVDTTPEGWSHFRVAGLSS